MQFPDFGPLLTYREAVKSATALRKGIDNTPPAEAFARMGRVYLQVYLPVCKHFGKIPVSSFFRSKALNRAVGGASGSQHVLGEAIDLDADGVQHVTNRELFDWIRSNLEFDQLILEAPDAAGNPQWVHVSFRQNNNRRQCLLMQRINGQPVYFPA